MDLIYADENRKDIGVLNSYDLDMAYGKDENDFACSVDRHDHCCGVGYFIYAENTEYGGIVDRIKIDTEHGVVSYMGRTWHGILESKVICPDAGDDYLILSGDANEVLQAVIDRIGLSGLFVASTVSSGTEVVNYQFDRYVYGYTGLCKFLQDNDLKLSLSWQNGMIVMSAEPIYDYSQDEEFDTSQVDFTIERNYRPVNHIICLGQGDLRNRSVIHIFADENGGVQDYLINPNKDPVEDSDYILDTSKQVMTDHDEVMQVYDASNAEITTNYIPLTAKPADWNTNCESYYQYEPTETSYDGEAVDSGGEYKPVQLVRITHRLQKKQPYDWAEAYDDYFVYDAASDQYTAVTGEPAYQLLSVKPGNWASAYGDYFKKSGSNYVAVTGVTTTRYVRQTKRPKDWTKNYGKYYYWYSDGVTTEYKATEGITYYKTKRQSRKPTDWDTNYGSYYRRATAKELKKNKHKKWYNVEKTKKNKVPKWVAKRYYTRFSYQKAPAWSAKRRYTKVENTKAPAWVAGTYYLKIGSAAPAWAAGKYYTKVDLTAPPAWTAGKYYRQALDHYAVMVAGALERLADAWESDSMDIDLAETDQTYDVGDVVGTSEQTTGISATQRVVKKIITIRNDDISISYEVG